MPSSSARSGSRPYQLDVLCKHTHTPDTRIQVMKGRKYLALSVEVIEQPYISIPFRGQLKTLTICASAHAQIEYSLNAFH